MGFSQQPRFPVPKSPDEIWQNDRDLQDQIEDLKVKTKTIAQLRTMSAPITKTYYCSDCATDAMCVSTGTAVGSFSRFSSKTTPCQ